MKQRIHCEEHQPITIDSKSGVYTRTPSKIKLNSLEDVRREMASVYREARGKIIDTSEAGRLAYILTGIGKLIEATDIDKRLEHMEKKFLK